MPVIIELLPGLNTDIRRLLKAGLSPEQAARAARIAERWRAAERLQRPTNALRSIGEQLMATAAEIGTALQTIAAAKDEDQLELAHTRALLALEDLRERAAAAPEMMEHYAWQIGAFLRDLDR